MTTIPDGITYGMRYNAAANVVQSAYGNTAHFHALDPPFTTALKDMNPVILVDFRQRLD